MDINDQAKFLDGISAEILQLVKTFFPKIDISGWGYAGPHFHVDLPDHFSAFENTPYYYAKELRFIHWTTIDKLVSIINTAEIRLYNLVNSEDEEEFNYAARTLNLNADQIENIKWNYFTFSFSEIKNLNDDHLWKIYGKDYTGIAIEFSIQKDINDWINYFISEVYYELPAEFPLFQNKIEELKKKYNNEIQLDFNIWKLAGFHKKSHFSGEREIRISTCFPYNYEETLKYSRKEFRIDGKKNRIVSYIPLKLWIDFDSHYPKEFYKNEDFKLKHLEMLKNKPKIKIENIYFGKNCNISDKQYYEVFRRGIQEMISFQLGYSIDMPLNLFDSSL